MTYSERQSRSAAVSAVGKRDFAKQRHTACTNAPGSGLFALNWEISVCVRLRCGAGSFRTIVPYQPVSAKVRRIWPLWRIKRIFKARRTQASPLSERRAGHLAKQPRSKGGQTQRARANDARTVALPKERCIRRGPTPRPLQRCSWTFRINCRLESAKRFLIRLFVNVRYAPHFRLAPLHYRPFP